MVTLQERYFQSLQTIITQLTLLIAQYPLTEQPLLTKFLSILENSRVNTSQKRMAFSNDVYAFIKENYIENATYIELPFLWFAIDYLTIANRILSIAGFHPDDFYLYLIKHLRKNPETQGVYELMKAGISLTDLRWEALQYVCNKFTVPLDTDEVQAIEISFSQVSTTGPRILSQQRIKDVIKSHITTPRFIRKLPNFYKSLNAQWNLRLFPPAFGLERLYFYFQLSEETTLEEVLGHKNELNTTLRGTDIYLAGSTQKYLGFILIPSRIIENMKAYLQRWSENKGIILFDLAIVNQIQISRSMILYEIGKGWRSLTSRERAQVRQQLQKSRRSEYPAFFLTPAFNTKWNYLQDAKYSSPAGYIDLYCKIKPPFSFQELPLSLYSQQNRPRFSNKEQQLLSYLYHKNVLQINFDPIRLRSDFSLDSYWIQIPQNVEFTDLQILLSYLPVTNIYNTETTNYLMTVLTPDLVQWLVQDLEWSVQSIRTEYRGKTPERNWYDLQALEWRKPHLLEI